MLELELLPLMLTLVNLESVYVETGDLGAFTLLRVRVYSLRLTHCIRHFSFLKFATCSL